MLTLRASVLLGLLFATTAIHAGTESEKATASKGDADTQKADWRGLGFSVGLGMENFKDPYIREARVIGDQRNVLIEDAFDRQASLWLQLNYVWDGSSLATDYSAPGMYVGLRAVAPDSQALDAFSLGVMWAFSRTRIRSTPPGERKSVNVGFGPVWHRTQQLASGIVEGQPLPSQFQQIEFEKRDEVSWMLMVSFGFQ